MATLTNVDLWPADIGQDTGELGPAALVKAQAALLSEKTKGLVTAEVRGEQDPRDEKFVDNFYLVGSAINYQYLLFTLEYPLEFYPLRLYFNPLYPQGTWLPGSEALGESLAEIFAHEKTRQVISAIIQRSK